MNEESAGSQQAVVSDYLRSPETRSGVDLCLVRSPVGGAITVWVEDKSGGS